MHRRDFSLGVPLAAAAALTIRRVAAQPQASLRAAQPEAANRMRREAIAFLGSLSAEQRRATSFALTANERTIWSNLPVALVPRVGVSLGELGDLPRQRAHALLRASSSSQGYLKMTATIRHDQVLHDMRAGVAAQRTGNAIIDSFGAGNFFIAVFGDPAHDENWGWLITGHHLGATFTVAGSRVTFMPLFLGAQPDLIETGPYAGEMVLGYEGRRAQELLRSLSTKQRDIAVLSTSSFRDVVAGPGRRQSLTRYEGIPGTSLEGAQQSLLWALVEEYVRNADFEPAAAQLDAIKTAGLGALHFSWRGPVEDDGAPFYYRIHGPRIIIEYAVQSGDHIHTIIRDPVNDYGSDWLGMHYEEHERG